MAGAKDGSPWNFSKINSLEDFMEKFWTDENGNILIKYLNQYAFKKRLDDSIRREKNGPTVYGIVLNNYKLDEIDGYKLVKVGLTHKSTKPDTNNRMETLEKQIKSLIEKAKKANKGDPLSDAKVDILFKFPIACTDTTPYLDSEDRVRESVGEPVKKEKIEVLKLPVPTEWVLTTQKHINHIKKETQKIETENKNPGRVPKDRIDIFLGDTIEAPLVEGEASSWTD